MLTLRELKNSDEYDFYRKSFYESLGADVSGNTKQISIDYLQNSFVVGIFDEHDNMVGGYTLGYNQPFRLLEFVPKGATLTIPTYFNWHECAEIVCVWKKPSVSGIYTSKSLWPHIFKNFMASGKKFLLGHNQSKKLDKHYGVLGPISLYVGPSTYGLPSHLFFYTRTKVRLLKVFALTVNVWIQRAKTRRS